MRKTLASSIVLILLLVSMFSFEFSYSQVSVRTKAILYVNPSTRQVPVNCSFSINVTVADVIDLYGFGCYLGYNSAVLKALTVTICPPFGGPIIIDEAEGYVYVTGMLPPEYPRVSGSFDLFSITLEAQSSGNTVLNLYDTVLIGSELAPMPHTTIDGFVEVHSTRLLLETDKSTYKLRENVTITLTNISNETVVIGGYPAWQIFTYPKEEPVYPEVFIYLAWSLEPGENDTITWNQFNEFTQSYVEPGTHVIRDNQGWGLNWYFKIVDAEIIVPDDYPTIQGAIDHANLGDKIYVRWGRYEGGLVVDKTVTLTGQKISPPFDYPIVGGVISVYANGVSISRLMTHTPMFPNNGVYLKNVSNCKISEMITYVDEGSGIWLSGSSNNLIAYNTARGLVWDGIRLEYSHNNTIIGNNVTMDWVDYGISLIQSSGNVISDNNIANAYTGIKLTKSSDNKIYHNNFIDMRARAVESHESMNFWDDGYPSGGNYWSDYAGEDLYSGPYQNETGSDGIGDTPYVIDENNQDCYPIMVHDVAVTNVTPSKTVVGQGYCMSVNVTIENQGDFTENFNVTVYANTTEIYTFSDITLTSRNSITITFHWINVSIPKGNYTISATAGPVPDETDTTDNTLVADKCICVTIPGDVDGDLDVDLYDAVKLLKGYGAKQDNPKYDPNCDIDGDGDIDLYDTVILLTHYGQKDP